MEAFKPRPFQPARREGFPEEALKYPHFRFMGSKHRLLRWIHEVLEPLEFSTALDLFSGSGCVAYLLKAMGKQVTATDFMSFSTTIARALVENDSAQLSPGTVDRLLRPNPRSRHFIERTFRGIFFAPADLRFLDLVWSNLPALENRYERDLAIAALLRSCVKRQPRGVFTVAGDPERYKDDRRDLRLSLKEHFLEQVEVFNAGVFSNGLPHRALRRDAFDVDPAGFELVYMDPPYVPRADDNCYMKRYHFLEGLSCYWEGLSIVEKLQGQEDRQALHAVLLSPACRRRLRPPLLPVCGEHDRPLLLLERLPGPGGPGLPPRALQEVGLGLRARPPLPLRDSPGRPAVGGPRVPDRRRGLMRRERQTFEDLVGSLSEIEVQWQDEFSGKALALLETIPGKPSYEAQDVQKILEADFEAGLAIVRLFLDMPKDEFFYKFMGLSNGLRLGSKSYKADRDAFVQTLVDLGLLERMRILVGTPVTWRDILAERLKGGRGSAIKGQSRGKFLEDFVEELVAAVFGKNAYDLRCRFVGMLPASTEKADFAIPSKEDPRILIEVKAYGATGSKQTDILGDMKRILAEKRPDTTLLLVTDGITWKSRPSDLRKLIDMQNQGQITRIYTLTMRETLLRDLVQLREEHGLPGPPPTLF